MKTYTTKTTVGEIEKKLRIKLGRPNIKLTTFLKKRGYKSLAEMLEK